MAVKYFSTENSPLLDERCYVRDDEIQMDDYSSVSSSSTDTFKSSSPIPYLNDNPVQSTFRRHTVLFLASFASLCIVLVFLTGYSLYGHEQYHNSLHGKGKQSRSRDGNLDSNGDASNTTASNTSADIDSQIKKRGTHNKKRNRKRHEDQIIAERAFRKHLVDHSSLNKNLPYQCHAQIIIIRHCEKKGSIRGHCNRVGYERAEYIATFFSNNKDHDSEIEDLNHIHVPSYLFATSPGHRNPHVKNYREIETLQPLSSILGVEINSKYGMNNKEELTKHLFELLKHGDLCGKVALISWKHDDVPRLARRYVPVHILISSFCYEQVRWCLKI